MAMQCHMAAHPILFIAPTRIGDAVLASAVLAYILANDPYASVTIATSPLAAPLYEGLPQLARIMPISKRRYNLHWLALWRATFPTRWHSVWDMRNSILSYTLRMQHRHTYTTPDDASPKVLQYARALGINALPYPTLWPRACDTAAAADIMPDGLRYLVLAPIANWLPKEWALASFLDLTRRMLRGTCAGWRPVIICAAHERDRTLPMLEALADFAPIDLTSGKAHLLTIYACMRRAHGFIGNDSGLMHMAAASGIPTLGLFGPTSSEVYQPWGARTTFIQAPENNMDSLTVAAVETAFIRHLQQRD